MEKLNEYRKELNREFAKEFRILFPDYIKNYQKTYYKNKFKNDINFRILTYLRQRLHQVLKGNTKSSTTIKLIGCSIDFLKQYLEKQFKQGMTWNNYGKWHIDHIRPCVSFDLSKPSEQKKCFNYINLQPLWAKDNLKKGGNYAKE